MKLHIVMIGNPDIPVSFLQAALSFDLLPG